LIRLFQLCGLRRCESKNGGESGSDRRKAALFYPLNRAGAARTGIKAVFAGWM
jgi:hypothetical protein